MKYPQVVSMPLAVTNWLEEQLEARGIDAVLYTRYVLSLLHTHTVDVIYPDEQEDFLHYSPLKKESRGRHAGGGRKRFRRSSEWWKHAHLDAEQLKRSAAVQCLMSASDQNCEIESLVDELCEKLKDIQNEQETAKPPLEPQQLHTQPIQKPKKVSPKEQAEKYYAAFPALGGANQQQQQQSPAKLLSLIPKWIQPPKKKPDSKKQATMKPRRHNNNYLSRGGKKDHLGLCRLTKSDSVTNWDSGMKRLRTHEPAFVNRAFEPDQCVEDAANWNNDEDVNMYDDLPVNIRELLDSPLPPEVDEEDTVEMLNFANAAEKKTNNHFISGNIISSIWSNDNSNEEEDVLFDNRFNAAVDGAGLDSQFRSITIEEQNETNAQFERRSFFEGFHSLPAWSDATEVKDEECFENEHLLNRVAVSLMKINHNKEKSSFAEIVPNAARKPAASNEPAAFNPFGFGGGGSMFPGRRANLFDKEDLLTSERSHFKPINEKLEVRTQEYADGSTFLISNHLDKVNYRRSDSGSMYLETEHGQSKKYCEYFLEDELATSHAEFVLKFSICQNDKACQTEEVEEDGCSVLDGEFTTDVAIKASPIGQRINLKTSPAVDEEEPVCTCPISNNNAVSMEDCLEAGCLVHPGRPESMLAEVMWRAQCDQCNNNNNNSATWSGGEWLKGVQTRRSQWDSPGLRSIWTGGEICNACLQANGGNSGGGRPPPDAHLREDISQDGEQLLSDLSSVQKCYRDDLPVAVAPLTADTARFASDISDFFVPKERKRRHSYMSSQHVSEEPPLEISRSSWSFASRLEEDCLIQMSTIPTLRSVTL